MNTDESSGHHGSMRSTHRATGRRGSALRSLVGWIATLALLLGAHMTIQSQVHAAGAAALVCSGRVEAAAGSSLECLGLCDGPEDCESIAQVLVDPEWELLWTCSCDGLPASSTDCCYVYLATGTSVSGAPMWRPGAQGECSQQDPNCPEGDTCWLIQRTLGGTTYWMAECQTSQ